MPADASPRPEHEWHEDMGPQLWWFFPIVEPPYCGCPLSSDWPGYHTHFTPIPLPKFDHILAARVEWQTPNAR